MRFALIATAAAALIAVPLAAGAVGPQMSSEQFLNAVRCTAYESAHGRYAELAPERMQLNAEMRHQSLGTAQQARTEARQIALQAVISESAADQAMVGSGLAAACAQAQHAENARLVDVA